LRASGISRIFPEARGGPHRLRSYRPRRLFTGRNGRAREPRLHARRRRGRAVRAGTGADRSAPAERAAPPRPDERSGGPEGSRRERYAHPVGAVVTGMTRLAATLACAALLGAAPLVGQNDS